MLELQNFLIKEHAGMFKMTAHYDILNPESGEHVGEAVEQVGTMGKLLRGVLGKDKFPLTIAVQPTKGGGTAFTIRRPFSLFRTRVEVLDPAGKRLGYFKSKLMSLSSGLWVYDDSDQQFAEVKGNWKSRDFRFLSKDGNEMGGVSKQWAGMAKEFFSSADHYVVSITGEAAQDQTSKILLLAAALAIDIVFFEDK